MRVGVGVNVRVTVSMRAGVRVSGRFRVNVTVEVRWVYHEKSQQCKGENPFKCMHSVFITHV